MAYNHALKRERTVKVLNISILVTIEEQDLVLIMCFLSTPNGTKIKVEVF